jgi:hypothetical protein
MAKEEYKKIKGSKEEGKEEDRHQEGLAASSASR